MSTVGENDHSNAPGVALKAVTDVTYTDFCNRSSRADLIAGYLKLPQTRESSCLWREKMTPFMPSHHTQHARLFFSLGLTDKGSSELRKSADKIHATHGWSPHASAAAQAGSGQVGLNQMPREKWSSLLMLSCCNQALRPLAVLIDYTTNFRLNH